MVSGVYERTEKHKEILRKCDNSGRFKKGHVSYKGMLGKKHSEVTKEKLKKIGKERNICGEKNPFYGKTHTKESIEKIKNTHKGKVHSLEHRRKNSETKRGDKNHQWKGGLVEKYKTIRRSLDFRLWKNTVFKRDNYSCQECGDNKGGNLNAHHIKSFAHYPDLRFEISNGQTLCEDCHKKTDNFGTKADKVMI